MVIACRNSRRNQQAKDSAFLDEMREVFGRLLRKHDIHRKQSAEEQFIVWLEYSRKDTIRRW